MTLVDTSVWIAHLRKADPELQFLLHAGEVVCHPFVVEELACGNLANRLEILRLLEDLPQAAVAEHSEILGFIEAYRLMGKGIGLVDVHLLSSSLLSGTSIWTRDKRLREVAVELDISCD